MKNNDISKNGLKLLKAKKDLLNFACELDGANFGIKELTTLNCRFAFNKGYLFFFYEQDYTGKDLPKKANPKQIMAYSVNFEKDKNNKYKTILTKAGSLYHTYDKCESYYPIMDYVSSEHDFLGKGVGSYLCKFFEKLSLDKGFYRFECVYGPDDHHSADYRVDYQGQNVHRAYAMYEKNNYKVDFDDRGKTLRYKVLDESIETEHKLNTANFNGLKVFAPFNMWQNTSQKNKITQETTSKNDKPFYEIAL